MVFNTSYKIIPVHNIKHYQFQGDQFGISPNKHTVNAPLVTVYGKDKQGDTYRYWIKNENGSQRIITPNLPDTSPQTAEHLVLCHTIKGEQGQNDVFYFFDPIQKALYLQSGPGNLTPSSTTVIAKRIPAKVNNVYSVQNNLFALTDEGLIYKADKNEHFTLESVSENWLNHQGTDWYRKLKNLPAIHDNPLPIYGLKGVDKTSLTAWFYQNKLIFAPNLSGKNLQLIKADENFAYLFDAEKGKLYKQVPGNPSALTNAFGNDYSLLSAQTISSAKELFSNEQFKAVWQDHGTTQLITKDGLILFMDNSEKPVWVGVDKNWEVAHRGNISSSITELAVKWPSHTKVIFIQSDNDRASKWYDFESNRVISAPNIGSSDQPQYLGIKINRGKEYSETYYINSNKGLFSYTPGPGNQITEIGNTLREEKLGQLEAHKTEDTILIKGSNENDILKPLIVQHVKNTVLCGGAGQNTYILKKEDRDKIKRIVLNTFDKAKRKDKLQMDLKDYYTSMLSRKGDNLIIGDQKGTVEIEKVFGQNKNDYNHLEIELAFEHNHYQTKTYHVIDLVEKMEEKRADFPVIPGSPGLEEPYPVFALPSFNS